MAPYELNVNFAPQIMSNDIGQNATLIDLSEQLGLSSADSLKCGLE